MDDINIKIEAYISGLMSKSEKKAFEQQINDNKSLKREVKLADQISLYLSKNYIKEEIPVNEFTQNIRFEIKKKETIEIKKKLLEVREKYTKANLQKSKRKKYFLVAASIVLFVVSSISLFFLQQNSTKSLFAKYYSAKDIPTVITRNNNHNQFVQGVLRFNNQDFQQAISLFDDYHKTSKDINPAVYIYAGIANWEINEYDKANIEFDKMISSNSIDSSKGLWFKALLYLKIKEKEKTKTTLLKLLENQSNFKYNEAKELLNKL